jgi:hypothetical protein
VSAPLVVEQDVIALARSSADIVATDTTYD